jgi:hypothetical protein
MTMRKQAGQTKKNTTTAAHKTTRRSAGTKTAAKSTPAKKASANTGLISDRTAIYSARVLIMRSTKSWALIL